MKQLLFALILLLSGFNFIQAQESNPYEETTWNVIRERLFNGENSKAYRFEDDIRFQIKGEASKEDSVVIQDIISELKELIKIVDLKLVNEDGNFIINFLPENSGIKQKSNYRLHGVTINYTELWFSFNNDTSREKIKKEICYYIYRYLTRIFENNFQTTFYGGIFDQPFPEVMPLNAIDKDLILKLYSKDFYKHLKENTVNKFGYLYYLNLRFEPWIKKFTRALSIVLVIAGFLYLLSGKKRKRSTTFLNYLIRGFQVLLWILASYLLLTLPDSIPFRLVSNMWVLLVAQALEVLVVGIVSIFLMFLLEHLFLKRISNFFYQQVFVLFNTFLSILFCYFFMSLPFFYFNLSGPPASVDYSQLFNPSMIFNYSIIAFLRVLYNFLEYKMQSIVNQKDVELAKMKELKNQAELNALHSRINPHFLYNSLNSIAELAHINPDKTENMAVALSELFRYSINKENKTFVTVEEELEMVKKYLEIEKTRFAEKLNYTITVDETAKEKLIPKFLIQPLAENAVKHGLSKNTATGKISIEVKQLENDLVIAIFDNGPDFPDEPVSGYGLQNLYDKLEILYGKQATIYWENGNNKHFRIIIKNQF